MEGKLTIKQEKFAQGLFAGLSQREAYKQAFNCERMKDKTIDEEACKLANNPKITTRVNELINELKERNMVTVEKILSELAKVGFSNLTDYLKVEEMQYIAGYEKGDDGQTDYDKPIIKTYKGVNIFNTDDVAKEKIPALAEVRQTKEGISLKTHDKMKALELMGKHLGMFTDKVEAINHNLNQDVSNLSDEELDAKLKKYGVKL